MRFEVDNHNGDIVLAASINCSLGQNIGSNSNSSLGAHKSQGRPSALTID